MNIKLKRLISAIIFTLICFVLFSPILLSGELYPVDFVVSIQGFLGKNFRYGAAYSNSASYYKLKMAQKSDVEVMALGTSRVMQLNDFFFNTDFYNAGGGFSSSDAALYFLQQLQPNKRPEYLILGLDEYFFNENYINVTSMEVHLKYQEPDVKTFSQICEAITADVKSEKISNSFLIPYSLNKIGIMAKVNNQGFEGDGSYYYGSVYKNPLPDSERIAVTIEDITERKSRYVAGNDINAYTIDTLSQLCEYAKEIGIKIIAFTPPLAPECYNLTQQGGFEYLDKINDVMKPIVDEYGIEFYNYTDVQNLGLDNSFFIDGFHGSDSAYLAILIDMLNKGSILNNVCDKAMLQEMYDNRIDNFLIQ